MKEKSRWKKREVSQLRRSKGGWKMEDGEGKRKEGEERKEE